MKKIIIATFLTAVLFSCKKISEEKNVLQPDATVSTASSNRTVSTSSIVQWQRPFGSSANEYPLGNVIVAAPGGGYVIAGNTLGNDGDVLGNHGAVDAWIVKLNVLNGVDWKYTYGGSASDYVYAIAATSDGGYIFAGQSKSTNGDVTINKGGYDVWVVKLDATGNKLWQKTYGGTADEQANAIIQTSDGGYLIAANTQSNDGDVSGNHGGSDVWILKLDALGTLLWQKTYGGSLSENASFILPTPDGNYMISAQSNSTNGDLLALVHHGGNDAWLFKIDGAGNLLLWQKTYGGSGSEGGGTVFNTSDGGYILSTATSSNNGDVSGNHGYYDTWVVKISPDGNIDWQKCYGGTDMDNARVRNINAAGQILVVGYTFSKNGDITGTKGGEDFWTLLLDGNNLGKILFSKNLGGRNSDTGEDAVANADGTYMAVGRTDSNDGDVSGNHGLNDIWIVKFKF